MIIYGDVCVLKTFRQLNKVILFKKIKLFLGILIHFLRKIVAFEIRILKRKVGWFEEVLGCGYFNLLVL
jgi:hypothetical protein